VWVCVCARACVYVCVCGLGCAQVVEDIAFLAAAFDLSSTVLTYDKRKFGDWAIGTTVVSELSDRAQREQMAVDMQEIDKLEKLVEHLKAEQEREKQELIQDSRRAR